jgi:hypothetical protein
LNLTIHAYLRSRTGGADEFLVKFFVPIAYLRDMRKLVTAIACLAMLLVAASPAWAGGGNSSVDQYTEQIPTAGGGNGGASGGGGSGSIPAATQDSLESQGSTGQAAATLAESTAPAPVSKTRKPKSTGQKAHGHHHAQVFARERPSVSPGGGSSPSNAVGQAVGGDAAGGMGIALPIIIGASSLAAIALFLTRRRTGTGNPRTS